MGNVTDHCTASRVGTGILAAFAVCGASWGFPMTDGEGALLLLACIVPAAATLLNRGTPRLTLAEVLHAVDRRD